MTLLEFLQRSNVAYFTVLCAF